MKYLFLRMNQREEKIIISNIQKKKEKKGNKMIKGEGKSNEIESVGRG